MYSDELYIPSLKEIWGLKPFNTSLQRELSKSLLNEDNYSTFVRTLNSVIKSCTQTTHHSKFDLLTLIDKLIICLHLRCISIGSEVEIEIEKDSKKYKTIYNFAEILYNISALADQFNATSISSDKFEIQCNIPSILSEKNLLSLYQEDHITYDKLAIYFIEYIKIDNNKFYFHTLKKEDKLKLLDVLPVNIIKDIINFTIQTIEQFQKILIYSVLEEKTYLTIIGQPYTAFLKFILDSNLLNIYQESYILSKHANMQPAYVDTITALERGMYISFIQQENEERSKTSESSSDSINLPIPSSDSVSSLDQYQQSVGG